MKHREIRAAVLSALKENISERVSWFDGRPVFIDEQELPAVAVYLTDASAADEFVDEGTREATLHIEVFLRAKEPDSALDMWMEEKNSSCAGGSSRAQCITAEDESSGV